MRGLQCFVAAGRGNYYRPTSHCRRPTAGQRLVVNRKFGGRQWSPECNVGTAKQCRRQPRQSIARFGSIRGHRLRGSSSIRGHRLRGSGSIRGHRLRGSGSTAAIDCKDVAGRGFQCDGCSQPLRQTSAPTSRSRRPTAGRHLWWLESSGGGSGRLSATLALQSNVVVSRGHRL